MSAEYSLRETDEFAYKLDMSATAAATIPIIMTAVAVGMEQIATHTDAPLISADGYKRVDATEYNFIGSDPSVDASGKWQVHSEKSPGTLNCARDSAAP